MSAEWWSSTPSLLQNVPKTWTSLSCSSVMNKLILHCDSLSELFRCSTCYWAWSWNQKLPQKRMGVKCAFGTIFLHCLVCCSPANSCFFFFFFFHFGDGTCTFHFLLGFLWYDLVVSWGLNVKTKQNQGSFGASFFSPIFLKQVGSGDSSVAERQTHNRKVLGSRSGWRIFFSRVN